MAGSRKGQKVASAACDLCRLRKVQCNFASRSDRRCTRCAAAAVDCTFLRGHQPRGRASRHVAAARQQRSHCMPNVTDASSAASPPEPAAPNLLVVNLDITQICPIERLELILNDFRDFIYPALPFVHLPTLMTAVRRKLWDETQRPLFQTAVAVAAATAASMPHRFSVYSNGQYQSVQAMVDRAIRLVLLSRVASPTYLEDNMTLENCVTSMFLAVATYYTGRQIVSQRFCSDAVVLFRSLNLYCKQGHQKLSDCDSEISKRLFWIFYIMQIYDRLDSIVPHYTFCFEASETDWEFLIPRESEDQHLHDDSDPDLAGLRSQPACSWPILSGFQALLKLFLCVLDVLSADFPRPPPSTLTALRLSTEPRCLASNPSSEFVVASGVLPGSQALTLTSMRGLMLRLQMTLDELPPELQKRPKTNTETLSKAEILQLTMVANIQITNLFVQSAILETYAAQIDRARMMPLLSPVASGEGANEDVKIWEVREVLAAETLKILRQFPREALEANGAPLFLKARKIAATLLERDEKYSFLPETTVRLDSYIKQFVHLLASLDYVNPEAK
ncbi:zn 2cys6 transcription factor [Lipomyces starkeyi]